jgi:C4-dicarboxylate transporter
MKVILYILLVPLLFALFLTMAAGCGYVLFLCLEWVFLQVGMEVQLARTVAIILTVMSCLFGSRTVHVTRKS